MRLAFAPLLLAACQQAEAPANEAGPGPAPKANDGGDGGDVSAAERLVRQRIGAGGEARFFAPRRSASDGVPIVCGVYEQGGHRSRYIVVNGEEAFVEPRMNPGEMDRAVAEFCGEGSDNRPPRMLTPAGNRQ